MKKISLLALFLLGSMSYSTISAQERVVTRGIEVATNGYMPEIGVMAPDFLATDNFGKKASAVAQLGVYTRDLDASYQTSLAMDIRMEAKELDYFLVDSEGLEVLNEGGMLLDLSAILDDSMKEELKDRLVELDNFDETDTGKYIGAIDITDSKFVNEFTDKNGKYYFAVAVTSERTENVVKMIKYLLKRNN